MTTTENFLYEVVLRNLLSKEIIHAKGYSVTNDPNDPAFVLYKYRHPETWLECSFICDKQIADNTQEAYDLYWHEGEYADELIEFESSEDEIPYEEKECIDEEALWELEHGKKKNNPKDDTKGFYGLIFA